MAAEASTTFTVHVKDLAGRVISIDMDGRDLVLVLKQKIRKELDIKFEMVVILTYLDESSRTFIELEDVRTLNSYKPTIDYEKDVLNLFVNIPIITHPISSDEKLKWQIKNIKNNNLLEDIPPGTTVIDSITPKMVGKIIYIVSPTNNTKGLQCAINNVDLNSSLIELQVIKAEVILTVMVAGGHQITKALQSGRVLLVDSVDGGRRKRSNRSKRRLMKKRRTRRK